MQKAKNPKISIITVCYNSEDTIRFTIESIISQNYENIEYLIIDGGSNDKTLEIINEYKDSVTFFNSEIDKGIYDAMNKGIKAANGDIIGILNSDDFYSNKSILSTVANSFSDNDIDALYGDLVYVDPVKINKILRYWKSGNYSNLKIRNGWMLPHPTFFVKKCIYIKYGLYNTSLSQASDYAMILNLIYKNKINVEYIPEILVYMRNGGKSNRSILNRLKGNKEDSIAWEINKLEQPRFIRFKKPLHKIKQFFQRPSK